MQKVTSVIKVVFSEQFGFGILPVLIVDTNQEIKKSRNQRYEYHQGIPPNQRRMPYGTSRLQNIMRLMPKTLHTHNILVLAQKVILLYYVVLDFKWRFFDVFMNILHFLHPFDP